MKAKIWFSLVVVCAILLTISFATSNIIIAAISLAFALYLQRLKSKVEFPKNFINMKIISFKNSNK